MSNKESYSFQFGKKQKLEIGKQSFIDHIGVGGIIGFVVAVLFLYFLLLGRSHDTILSLTHLLNWTEHLQSIVEQLAVIIILPIYLAILIFGGAIVGIISGVYVQRNISKLSFLKTDSKKG